MVTELENDFKLKFEGDLNEVDASTLGYSLLNITTLVQEVNQDAAPDRKIEIKVKANQPGSFLVHLGLEPAASNALLDWMSPEGVALAGGAALLILKIVVELFKLRKELKGEKPKEVIQREDEYEIRTGDNASIIVDKRTYNSYFNNPKINEALSKTFKTLEADPSITAFEITDVQESPLFEADREDFRGMALSTSVPQAQTKSIVEETQVYIVKPSFERSLKWDVVYRGIRTPVAMKDEGFLNRIDSGEKFAKGDILAVDMRIEQVLDPSIGTYVNKAYEIIRVREHIPRPEQSQLFKEGHE